MMARTSASAVGIRCPRGVAKLPRITVLQPDPDVPLDRFDAWLRARVRLSLIDLRTKDVPRPETIGDALIVLGGHGDALSSDRKTLETLDLLADAYDIGLPILGLCLGHQLLAHALGGEVTVAHPDGPEFGPELLTWLPDAATDPVLAAAAASHAPVPMAHHDVVTRLPEGAVELARSALYPHAAFRVGDAWGVQFHPEASPELMQHWWTREHRSTLMLDRMRAVDAAVEPAMRSIAEGFLDVVVGASH